MAAILVAGSALAAPVHTGKAVDIKENSCHGAITATERRLNMPGQLLLAVALAESGRYDKRRRASIAWPWTVTSGKNSHYHPDRASAIRAVKRLQARGVRNIDVGCMQINLAYHPRAFKTLEAAFTPETNVAYGAHHLMKLYKRRHSWTLAVGLYHSATKRFNFPYRRKVMKLWSQERRRFHEAERRRVMAESERRRRRVVAAYEARQRKRHAMEKAKDEARRTQIAQRR